MCSDTTVGDNGGSGSRFPWAQRNACKNQLIMVSVQYGTFNTYIPIRSTIIGKSRVARDPTAMHTSWRSNSDIASVTRQTHLPKTHQVLWPEIYHTIVSSDNIGYPRMRARGESSTMKHRLLHESGPHPIPPPNDPKCCSGNQLVVDACVEVIEFALVLESAVEMLSAVEREIFVRVLHQSMSDRVSCWYFICCILVGSSSNADVDFRRWSFSCDGQQRALRDSEATTFCEQEPAVGFPGYSAGRGVGPTGGAPGGG
ncbi:hypothetical protein F511_20265 [Dorcoceras hygrometricum]|uniref:Uncharacterized protein n=1 Tax=Dorcoceras hygrometricum TaxID=472368 RepID=A0A2Z7BY31_9LAMI|nr:hypothetical protein F511_20265 [Dorcoceras hygrometricum]